MELARLRSTRLRLALSQADLAARSGVEKATISRLEGGRQRARPSTARKLAQALGVEPAELLADGDGDGGREDHRR